MIRTTPEPSLCDTCSHAHFVTGGSAAIFYNDGMVQDCRQRYCGIFHIAIHFSGKNECMEHALNQGETDNVRG